MCSSSSPGPAPRSARRGSPATRRAALIARGHHGGARASRCSRSTADDAPTDADVLAAATGADPGDVCPPHRWLPTPMAPPMAADALGLPPFTIADLAAEIPQPPTTRIVLVESAGGVRSPLAADGDTVDLAAACAPALVVLVADAGLGTINVGAARVGALARRAASSCTSTASTRDDDLHRRNRDWLAHARRPRGRHRPRGPRGRAARARVLAVDEVRRA